jgi:threonine dehydratase
VLSLSDILAAQQAIAGVADHTPMIGSPFLTEKFGHEFLLKLEIAQPIGAFKLRGALNAIAQLGDEILGVACCSTGNHGRAIAYAARLKGLKAVVFMSSLVPQTKIDGIKQLGAEVRIVGQSQDEAMAACAQFAKDHCYAQISPFDDKYVVAGQGTIAMEMLSARPDLENLLVPLSGGGLAAGIGFVAKRINPTIRIIGVSMDRGAAMAASIAAGQPVEVEEVPSLADSLGGGVGLMNKLSFPLCRDFLSEIVLVEEPEIYRAMQTLYFEDQLVAEGASVVGIAAALGGKIKLSGPTATIITGKNVDMQVFTDIVSGKSIQLGDLEIEGSAYA